MSLFSLKLRSSEITIMVLLVTLMVLPPPLSLLWLSVGTAWFFPYLIWLGIILLTYWLHRLLREQ